ncbi:hypothetical protein GCM10011348_02620 [Marinobacterium nitratireducens]|uniref:Uncharacterized protein n=1 Tax=Marinobacterium nitratireducens TaxID=518897 RepID=A0A917Z6I3_9GAMM|nr:hypothetical protein [Marinobacterium nitratireducens]GGO76134.1 hypothetical protein GCM10011348_02620 [Marinobacterium nitratireducens]
MKRKAGLGVAAMAALLLGGCSAVATDSTGIIRGDIAVERLALLPEAVLETSGLARIDGQLWTINDSGNEAALYQLSASGDALSRTLYLAGARNIDWEALAADDEQLYVADCGNNRGRRTQLDLYRVARTELGARDGSRIDSRRMQFRYGDRTEVTASDSHNYDCEALTVVDGSLWMFSKNRGDGRSSLYRLDPSLSEQAVFPEASYPVDGLVTGADFDPVGRQLALVGYSRERLPGYSFLWLVPVPGELPDWSAARRYRLGVYAQWEAVSWDGPRRLVLSAERSALSDTMLGEIRLDEEGRPPPARQATRDLW